MQCKFHVADVCNWLLCMRTKNKKLEAIPHRSGYHSSKHARASMSVHMFVSMSVSIFMTVAMHLCSMHHT